MKFCGECGQTLEDSNKFCGMCGAVVTANTEMKNEVITSNLPNNVTISFKKNHLQFLQQDPLDVSIDGAPKFQVAWNKPVSLNLSNGNHKIKMSFYYLGTDCGKAEIDLMVVDNKSYTLSYYPPMVVYSKGKITIKES